MQPIEIVAQAVSILAMAFNILSYQCKTQKGIITLQFFGSGLFALSFFLLGSLMGMLMNLVNVIRAAIYREKERLHADHILWLIGFIALFLITYLLSFTVFGTEPSATNLIVELLPVIGSTASTISFRLKGARVVRLLGLISSPAWLIYNIVAFSVGAILCEAISLVSILVALFRFDRKPKATE